MDASGKFIEWRFNAIETLGFGLSLTAMAVTITLWSVNTFQSKEDAKLLKEEINTKIVVIETQVNTMRSSIEGVAKDVSYIRGRLEPNNISKGGK